MAIGIENLEKAARVLGKVGTAVGGALEDGKINMADVDEGIQVIMLIPEVTSLKLAEAKEEFKDLDAEEKARLAVVFKESFDLVNDDIEADFEEGLDLVLAGIKFFGRIFRKKATAA